MNLYLPLFWGIQLVWLLLVLVLISAIMDRNSRLKSVCDDLQIVCQKRSLLTGKEDDRLLLNAWATSRTGLGDRLQGGDGI